MDIFLIFLKLGLLYLVIMVTYRLMGKKNISELSIMDLIVFLIISNIIALYIPNTNQSFLFMLILIAFIIALQSTMTYISSIIHPFKYMFKGKPSVIIKNGKLNFKEMIKRHYRLEDLLKQLSEKNIKKIENINYAVLENNGMLSIYDDNTPIPIILDGQIQSSTLKRLNKNEDWINNIIDKEKVALNNIFYAFYNKGKVYIIKYE